MTPIESPKEILYQDIITFPRRSFKNKLISWPTICQQILDKKTMHLEEREKEKPV